MDCCSNGECEAVQYCCGGERSKEALLIIIIIILTIIIIIIIISVELVRATEDSRSKCSRLWKCSAPPVDYGLDIGSRWTFRVLHENSCQLYLVVLNNDAAVSSVRNVWRSLYPNDRGSSFGLENITA